MESETQNTYDTPETYTTRILVIGAGGQIGSELVDYLRNKHGVNNVISSDLRQLEVDAPFETLNVMDDSALRKIVSDYEVSEVYLLAALLSATAEKNPKLGWDLNMQGLFNVLNLAKEGLIKKIFWPSSIAVFGPHTPGENTGQHTVMDPTTVYGISKLAGERWCEYYHLKHGVDVRSIRYPGLISWKSQPGGGTTDYAVDIFYGALKEQKYTCFLSANRALPMMYMDDAIKATVQLMEAPAHQIKIRSSYNLGGISFTPEQIAEEIRKHIPEFTMDYDIDFRDQIAQSWPNSIDDSRAHSDWGWVHQYDLTEMVTTMLKNLSKKLELAI